MLHNVSPVFCACVHETFNVFVCDLFGCYNECFDYNIILKIVQALHVVVCVHMYMYLVIH